jgi:N-acetylglutamate synthase-like GNAT family acetyltransferase
LGLLLRRGGLCWVGQRRLDHCKVRNVIVINCVAVHNNRSSSGRQQRCLHSLINPIGMHGATATIATAAAAAAAVTANAPTIASTTSG